MFLAFFLFIAAFIPILDQLKTRCDDYVTQLHKSTVDLLHAHLKEDTPESKQLNQLLRFANPRDLAFCPTHETKFALREKSEILIKFKLTRDQEEFEVEARGQTNGFWEEATNMSVTSISLVCVETGEKVSVPVKPRIA